MRWPFMSRSKYKRDMAAQIRYFRAEAQYDAQIHQAEIIRLGEYYHGLIDAEYDRAYSEGRSQVHAFAVEVTYNLFHEGLNALSVPRFRQVLQELEKHFNPDKKALAKWTTVMSAIKEDT